MIELNLSLSCHHISYWYVLIDWIQQFCIISTTVGGVYIQNKEMSQNAEYLEYFENHFLKYEPFRLIRYLMLIFAGYTLIYIYIYSI